MSDLARKVLLVCAAAAVLVGLSSHAFASRLAIRFVAPSPGEGMTLKDGSVSFRFEYPVKPKATQKLRCAISGPTSLVGPCNRPVVAGTGSRSGKSYKGLAGGTYRFTVSLIAAGGSTASATRHFRVGVAVIALAAGDAHTCALTSGGGVKCWGDNYVGQLGDGSLTERSIPVDVSGLSSGVIAIDAGAGSAHTCALTRGGAVKCWGDNSTGQLGDGTFKSSSIPVDVAGLSSGVRAIAGGYRHICALTGEGGVKCWGDNYHGQLGNGTSTSSSTPADVLGLASGVAAIAAGGLSTCALTNGGAVKCWGVNPTGQLVKGSTRDSSTPVDVPGLASGVHAITAGADHSCALMNDGAVKCWGDNPVGELGNGTTSSSSAPVDVIGLVSDVTAITAGGGHTCALTSVNAVACWGSNFSGELGNGTNIDSSTPVRISGLASITAIAAGDGHTCALTNNGPVFCWGWNRDGQLGNRTNIDSQTPIHVYGLSSAPLPRTRVITHSRAGTSCVSECSRMSPDSPECARGLVLLP